LAFVVDSDGEANVRRQSAEFCRDIVLPEKGKKDCGAMKSSVATKRLTAEPIQGDSGRRRECDANLSQPQPLRGFRGS